MDNTLTLLGILLVVNAVLHAVIVGRFGFNGNAPPAVFAIVYGALALAVFVGWSGALLVTLVVTALGLLGLAVNFRKLQHETRVEKLIFVIGAAILVSATYAILVP